MKGDVEKGYWERGREGGVESEGVGKESGDISLSSFKVILNIEGVHRSAGEGRGGRRGKRRRWVYPVLI